MSDQLALCVDRLSAAESLQAAGSSEKDNDSSIAAGPDVCAIDVGEVEGHDSCDEEEVLLQTVECRICQDEDRIKNLEAPCSCSGSLKFAHRECVQRWCNEKGDVICEICHQCYEPGYTAPPPPPQPEVATIDISERTFSGAPLRLHDRQIPAVAPEPRILEPGYDEYSGNDSSGTEFFRAAAITLVALLFLRHALYLINGDKDDDNVSRYIWVSLLHAAAFLLPCYIVAWVISILQWRREQQETATIAAADVAITIQAAQTQVVRYSIAPGPSVTPQQEPLQ
ncbi:hypothetical protein V6N13_086431 [Hibiscus sabdariffa]|uniref:RING-CH-type domain-containing protein n=1 Tax=Hibiscus sabdariffa TaxID=183260 RepID=A0ABR2FTQ5_9ROSI